MTTCSAIGGINCDAEKITLSDATGQAAIDSVNHSRLADAVLSGIEGAFTMPGNETRISLLSQSSGAEMSGPISQEKAAFLSRAAEASRASCASTASSREATA